MNDLFTGQMAAMVAAISFMQPSIVNVLKSFTKSIKNAELKKSVNFLMTVLVGISIAWIVNYVGNYGLEPMEVFMIATGISFPIGQVAHRLTKLKNGK